MHWKTRRTTATRTEPNTESNVPGEKPTNGVYGESEVERIREFGLPSTTYYKQTF